MKTILVADDFKSIRNFICDMLQKKGYQTIAASDGHEAFNLILQHAGNIDAVITDYNMPGCSGPDLLTLIKKHPLTKSVPVVFLTTENDPQKIKRAQELGVADWIKKPYKTEVFFSTLAGFPE